jgi:hypothetical protein
MAGMSDISEAARRSREVLAQLLLSPSLDQTTPEGLFRVAEHHAQRESWRFDWFAALEYWWELARIGAVALLGGGGGSSYAQAPQFMLTAHGRRLLQRGDSSPHDETRYLSALRRRVPSPDPVALSYLNEGIAAWRAGLYRSSVVMVGCACERLIVILADAVAAANVPPFSADVAKLLAPGKPSGISQIFDKVHKALSALGDERRVPGDLTDAIERRLTPMFERTRWLRNKSGHPTGADVPEEEAEAGLLLFPDYCEYVSKWIAALQGLGGRP